MDTACADFSTNTTIIKQQRKNFVLQLFVGENEPDMSCIFTTLCNDFINAGITKGMVLMVHSSFKSLGPRASSPSLVIDALKHVLTSEGTLLMPALTYSTVTRSNPYFSYNDTPSCVGIISEIFRKSENVIRSLNPVHSVCAWGKYSKELTANHKNDAISIGENSPYRLLPKYGGKILMLGCGLLPNTFMHGVENAANAPYRGIKYTVNYTIQDEYGHEYSHTGLLPDMSMYIQRYDRVKNILTYPEIMEAKILDATSFIIDSEVLMKKGVAAIKSDPYYFVDSI